MPFKTQLVLNAIAFIPDFIVDRSVSVKVKCFYLCATLDFLISERINADSSTLLTNSCNLCPILSNFIY